MGFAYDPAGGAAEVLGDIRDPSIDDGCYLWRCIVK